MPEPTTGGAYPQGDNRRLCTCGCGKRTDADYWHAWQAGRAKGWNEGYGRPYWWMRLCYLTSEAWFWLTHRGRS